MELLVELFEFFALMTFATGVILFALHRVIKFMEEGRE
jgi:hypothetical protein